MTTITLKTIIEGLLMAAEEPLAVDDIFNVLEANNGGFSVKEIRDALSELSADYQERGIVLKEVASGYRFQVRQDLSDWVSKLNAERPLRYSRALLETLALVAYRQPITRAEIEDVRGVAVGSNIIKTLLEHEWVRIIGHKDVPGKPALFATTRKFLDHFNLKGLEELPSLIEFTEVATVQENILVTDLASDAAT